MTTLRDRLARAIRASYMDHADSIDAANGYPLPPLEEYQADAVLAVLHADPEWKRGQALIAAVGAHLKAIDVWHDEVARRGYCPDVARVQYDMTESALRAAVRVDQEAPK